MSALNTIVIPTRRSPVLRRCVDSFTAGAREFGHDVRFVVSEDGDGNPRREWWVQRLSAEVVPEQMARFLLYGDPSLGLATTGANRNLLLLETAGEAVLSVDDDTVCEWRRVTEPTAGGTRTWLHPSLDAARAARPAESFDFLNYFGGLLHSASPVVQAGLCGDVATNSPLGRLMASGPEREEWMQQQDLWRSRAVTRAPGKEILVDAPHLMTYCVALDGRQPLVPFAPIGRNQDALFALTLRMAGPPVPIRYVPWCIWHEPSPARDFPADVLKRETGLFHLTDGVALLLRYRQAHGLRPMAAWLEELGRWDPPEFRRLFTALRCQSLSDEIAVVANVLRLHGSAPSWWARELRAVMLNLEETMAGERLLAGAERLQPFLASFGALLRQWPSIWECAQTCRRLPE